MSTTSSRERYQTLPTSLSFGEWVEVGAPTELSQLREEEARLRTRVLESVGKLPVIQDEFGRHLDELSPPSRRCEGCGAILETVRVERAWLLPLHTLPEQTTPCMGAYAAGSEA